HVTAPPRGRVVAALLALYFIWGSTYLGIRLALPGFPPLMMSGLRFVVAGGLFYVLLRLRGLQNPTRTQWFAALRIGTLLILGNGLVVVAEQWVSSGVAAVAIASVPLWSVLFAGLWGRWPGKGEWIGLIVGLAGVALLQSGGELRASPAGAVVLVLSAITWSLGSMWSTRLPLPAGPMAAATEMLTGGTVILVAALLRGERMTAIPDAQALGAFAYLVVFGSIVAYTAYAFLLARVRPALATSYAYVSPVIAVFLGAIVAAEQVTAAAVGALALILGGVAIIAVQRAPAKKAEPVRDRLAIDSRARTG
ncbi:MAG TPA: drug/metabolite exporter YedA, partial [Myxococcales bacterium]|nr:drug/metabolite exporter YedA [Myxococcales bacterium]